MIDNSKALLRKIFKVSEEESKEAFIYCEDLKDYFNEKVLLFLIEVLTPKEYKIIVSRFGLGKEGLHTLEELGKQFDVTPGRVRQIEATAFMKLRANMASSFGNFLERNGVLNVTLG